MSDIRPSDAIMIANIEQYGWHVVMVMEEDDYPRFAYSVGLYESFGHPEIIMIGLKFDLMHLLINNMGSDIRQGKTYIQGQFYPNILDDFKCLIIEVAQENYDEYVGRAQWYYDRQNTDFPLLQCIYPSVKGVYPWEEGWPEEIKNLQPILGELP